MGLFTHSVKNIKSTNDKKGDFDVRCEMDVKCTGRARLIRSHSSARFYFELSGNLN